MPGNALPLAATLIGALLLAHPAAASDRWEEAGSGAVAILPEPLQARAITGASFVCAEQRWTLRLRTEGSSAEEARGSATIAIDDDGFTATAAWDAGAVAVPMPKEALQLLREGSRLKVALDGLVAAAATFSLKNSRAVLGAVAPRCSQVDMSAYEELVLSPTDPAAGEAAALLAEELTLFRNFAGKEPSIAALRLDLAGGKRLLFASVCGSTRYYGDTGCKLTGFAAEGSAGWRPVYESEGMRLHRDPKASTDGWPDLATVASVNGDERLVWAWNGESYALRDVKLAEDAALGLRGTSEQ